MAKGRLRDAAAARLGALWWAFAVRGALFAAFGLATLVWPSTGLTALVWIVGIYLILDGVAAFALSREDEGSNRRMLRGAAGVLIGAAALLWPGATGRALVLLLALWLVWQGVDMFLSGRELARESEAEDGSILRGVGAAFAAIGAAALIWRGVGEALASWLTGLAALAIGAALLFVALRLRRLGGRIRP